MTRNKRSSEEWFSLIQECRTSGLSVKDFCAIKGIHPSNFYYWSQRHRTTQKEAFVPVMICKPPINYTILQKLSDRSFTISKAIIDQLLEYRWSLAVLPVVWE
jgi:transposase-like protein